MATLSDQLAADIHQAFSKYYTDLSNQDQIFFGIGDVQITKQDGTTATVCSWNKVTGIVNGAAQREAENIFTRVNTFSAGINVSGDNTMIVMGKNQDIGFVKKAGAGGAVAVGSTTPFRVVRSNKEKVSPGDTYTDIMRIDASGLTTFFGDINLGEFKLNAQAIVSRELRVDRTADIGNWAKCRNDFTVDREQPAGPVNGTLLSGGVVKSRMLARGGNGDAAGAWGGFYIEEQVGAEHRIVFYLDGFGSKRAWFARSDGTFEASSFWSLGKRVRSWSAVGSGYLECYVDNAAKGINFFDSDERLKEGINDVRAGSAGEVIGRLRPVSFRYKDTAFTTGKSYCFGLVAQEAEQVLPELVNTHSDGMKALDPLAVIGLLLAHNKELQKRIEALEKK